MRDLTPEEFLVDFCMKPENTSLALAIGQIQTRLRQHILLSFIEKLDKSVKNELNEKDLGWESRVPEPPEKFPGGDEYPIYILTMLGSRIEIHLVCQKRVNRRGDEDYLLYVGSPEANEACPKADRLAPFFEGKNLNLDLETESGWPWWFYLGDGHKAVEDWTALLDEESRWEKIRYLTDILVFSAEVISKELEA